MGVLILARRDPEAEMSLQELQAAYVARGFGLFVCFNMSTFTDEEWASPTQAVDTFAPSDLDVQQWIDVAVAMQATYICLTVKHHDGFCLWPTATTTHDIAATEWYDDNDQLDIVDAFVTLARAAGLVPIIYFSIWDTRWETDGGRLNQSGYRAYLEAQITELLTNYGPIAGLWLDGTAWQFSGTAYPWSSFAERNAFVRSLQSQCLVVDNSHLETFVDSDIIVYEGGTQGDTVPENNTDPAEVIDTMHADNTWFAKSGGNQPLTANDLLAQLALVNGRNAAFLCSVGPDTTGQIPANMVSVLEQVGEALS